jgi:putative nucleotidyltransferase with HDIG domain
LRGLRAISKTSEKNMKGREEAWCLLTEFTQSESLRKHALSVEVCMRAYAAKFGGDAELWGVVGLLHDFDYEQYPSLEDHPYKGNEILKDRGWSEEIRRAIMSHAEYSGVTRDSPMEKAPICLRRTRGIHYRLLSGEAREVTGRGRSQVGAKEDERQSLRPECESRRYRQRSSRFGSGFGRAHRVLH